MFWILFLWQGENKQLFFLILVKFHQLFKMLNQKKIKIAPNARNNSICKIWLFALWQH
jgi:hypothetical protein